MKTKLNGEIDQAEKVIQSIFQTLGGENLLMLKEKGEFDYTIFLKEFYSLRGFIKEVTQRPNLKVVPKL